MGSQWLTKGFRYVETKDPVYIPNCSLSCIVHYLEPVDYIESRVHYIEPVHYIENRVYYLEPLYRESGALLRTSALYRE